MGAPFFEVRRLLKRNGGVYLSSNYSLYGEISGRVMSLLTSEAPQTEVYSIDEAFLDLAGLRAPEEFSRILRSRVGRWVGVPVSIGLAPTKTLTKVANWYAKRYPRLQGVAFLATDEQRKRALAKMPVEEIWGVGSRLTKRLAAYGIRTAGQLADMDPKLARRIHSVNLERTVWELRGVSCYGLEMAPEPRQQIICSRSFGRRVTALEELLEAITAYADRAAVRMRAEGQKAQLVTVFLQTSPFAAGPRYANQAQVRLPASTEDSRRVIAAARRAMEEIYRSGYAYSRAGVMLAELQQSRQQRLDLFSASEEDSPRSERLMSVMDEINRSRLGKIQFAGGGLDRPWAMRRGHLSPGYMSNWKELAPVRA